MDAFAMMGFIFGLSGFISGTIGFIFSIPASVKVKELEKRMADLENKL